MDLWKTKAMVSYCKALTTKAVNSVVITPASQRYGDAKRKRKVTICF
jgi:hypothetical protein